MSYSRNRTAIQVPLSSVSDREIRAVIRFFHCKKWMGARHLVLSRRRKVHECSNSPLMQWTSCIQWSNPMMSMQFNRLFKMDVLLCQVELQLGELFPIWIMDKSVRGGYQDQYQVLAKKTERLLLENSWNCFSRKVKICLLILSQVTELEYSIRHLRPNKQQQSL